jgi:non-specific serine/threonine protein kinase
MLAWLDRLEREHDNLRSALAWARERDPDLGLQLAGTLGPFWSVRGYAVEGRAWLSEFLAQTGPRPASEGTAGAARLVARARALAAVGGLAVAFSDPSAAAVLEASIALAQQAGDQRIEAWALGMLALATASEASATESIELSRREGYTWELAFSLTRRAEIVAPRDMLHAQGDLEESVRLARKIGNPLLLATVLTTAGLMAAIRRDTVAAYARLEESVALFDQIDDKRFANFARSELAHLLRRYGEYAKALRLYGETITAWVELGHLGAVAHQLESLAMIATVQRQARRAAKLLGAAEALRETVASPMHDAEREEYDRAVVAVRDQLDAATFAAAWAAGRAMTLAEAVAYALEDKPTPE